MKESRDGLSFVAAQQDLRHYSPKCWKKGHFRVPKTPSKRGDAQNLYNKISFFLRENKNHFKINSFALSLALKQKLGAAQKGVRFHKESILGVRNITD